MGQSGKSGSASPPRGLTHTIVSPGNCHVYLHQDETPGADPAARENAWTFDTDTDD
jgi:hypothetical protein